MSETGSQPPPETVSGGKKETLDKKVWRNVAGLVGGNTLGEILTMGVHAQMLNILGPGGYGQLGQATAVMNVADGAATFGLNQVGPVLGVEYPDRLGKFLGTVLGVRTIVTVIVLGLVMLLAPMLESTAAWIVRLAGFAILLSPLASTATIPYYLKQENWKIAWLPGANALVSVGLLILVLFLAPRVEWVIAAIIATRIFNAVVLTELARRRYGFRYQWDSAIAKRLLQVGPKAGWLDVVVITYSKASYFVLDGLGSVMLGIYTVADKISQPILRISGALSASSLPVFADLAQTGTVRELSQFYLRCLRRISVALVLIGVVILLGAAPVLEAWFPDYIEAVPVLHVLYLGVCFMAVNQITSSILNGLGHFGWVAFVATINLGVYAVGAWLWVGPYKATGAAMATTFMEGCNMCMQIGLLAFTLKRRAKRAQETSA